MREVPTADDSDPEFDDATAAFPTAVEIHADSDPDFDVSEDIFADVQRPKTPSQAAAIVFSELDKVFPGFASDLKMFGGETPEENMKAGLKYLFDFDTAVVDVQNNPFNNPGRKNPLEYVMESLGFRRRVARSDYLSLPSDNKTLEFEKLKEHFLGTQRVLTSAEMQSGLAKLLRTNGSIGYGEADAAIISGIRRISQLDSVKANPTDPKQAAKETITTLEFSTQGRSPISNLFRSVSVPFSMAESTENLEKVNDGLGKLNEFFKNKNYRNITKNTRLVVAKDRQEVVDNFYALHPDVDRSKYTPERIAEVLGFNAASNPDNPDGERTIVINPEALEARGRETENFGGTAAEATIAHEYAHTIQKSISTKWGDDGDEATEAYKNIAATETDISEYANTNIKDHFAENFARYVVSGEASDEFKKYLEEYAGIKEINVSDYTHPTMGTSEDLEQQLNQVLNSNPDSPFEFSMEIYDADTSVDEISRILSNGGTPPRSISRIVNIQINDKRGNPVGTIRTQFSYDTQTKKFEIDAGLFELKPRYQGQGIAEGVVGGMAEYVKALGGGRVKFSAALDNGPYAWAMKGGQFTNPEIDGPKYKEISSRMAILAEWWRGKQDLFSNLTDSQKKRIAALYENGGRLNTPGEELPDEVQQSVTELLDFHSTNRSNGLLEWDDTETFLFAALQNGWKFTEEDVQALRDTRNIPDARILPADFAQIGRESKSGKTATSLGFGRRVWDTRSSGDTIPTSSIGRIIMMMGHGWRGYIDLRPGSGGR